MPAGQRRERVIFQQRAVNGDGDRLGDWELPGVKRWARVVARTRGETVLQQRLQQLQPLEITVLRDQATRQITAAWRVLWNDAAFNVQAVAPGEDRAELSILALGDGSDA